MSHVSPRSPLEVAETYVAAYNSDDLDLMRTLMHPEVRVRHHNRGVDKVGLDDIFEGKRRARTAMPDKRFHGTRSTTVASERVVIEHSWSGHAVQDFPGFASAGDHVQLDLCTVFTVENGLIIAYDDYG
jgi:predicted ester cyclase